MCARDSREWYEDWADEDYRTLYAHRDVKEAGRFVAALWTHLELQRGLCVADVPCGAGRHSLAFAARGARAVGVDGSRLMLNRAAAAAADYGVQPDFVQGDMRCLPLGGGMQVVLSAFSSVGTFEHDDDNGRVVAEWARLLTPGGVAVIDVINPAYLRQNFVSEMRRFSAGTAVIERREIEAGGARIRKLIEIQSGAERRVIRESVRLYDDYQLVRMTLRHGLTPVDIWGDYNGKPYVPEESPRLILFARK